MSMADLLAKQKPKPLSLSRGQEVDGVVVAILPTELILDLGTKAEGILSKKGIPQDSLANLKIGDKLTAFVIHLENESGQVSLALQRAAKGIKSQRFEKFISAQNANKVLVGRGIEVNKGGLIVEIDDIRGFLPSSQVSLSQAAQLDSLIGQDVSVCVIEVDSSQNRLIFSQKTNISEDIKSKLSKLKEGDRIEGEVSAILPFGIFVTLKDGVEGLVHISEISWEKTDDPSSQFRIGEKVSAKVISTDPNSGRVNLSIKQLITDPFEEKVKNINPNDVAHGVVTKLTAMGVFVDLDGGVEGLVHSSKLELDSSYEVGKRISFLVDSVDIQKRRVNLVPFVTSTKGLIYK